LQQTATKPKFRIVEKTTIGDVCEDVETGQKSFFSNRSFRAGEKISSFAAGKILDTPTYLTVQLGDTQHILLDPVYLQYINHSCDPNCFFDSTHLEIIALRDIASQEELFFFYPSTEWDMSQPFVCNCKTPACLHIIQGAKHLSNEQAATFRLNKYILNKRNGVS
jgi:hypothetical protein